MVARAGEGERVNRVKGVKGHGLPVLKQTCPGGALHSTVTIANNAGCLGVGTREIFQVLLVSTVVMRGGGASRTHCSFAVCAHRTTMVHPGTETALGVHYISVKRPHTRASNGVMFSDRQTVPTARGLGPGWQVERRGSGRVTPGR